MLTEATIDGPFLMDLGKDTLFTLTRYSEEGFKDEL